METKRSYRDVVLVEDDFLIFKKRDQVTKTKRGTAIIDLEVELVSLDLETQEKLNDESDADKV